MNKRNLLFILVFLLAAQACTMPGAAPNASEPNLADPNAFNTMVALTSQARPPAVTREPTLSPTPKPVELVRATIPFPRHTGLDMETQTASAPLVDMDLYSKNRPDLSRYYLKAPAGSDLVFHSENPTDLSWQFLYPVNGALIATTQPPLRGATLPGCLRAFGETGYRLGPNQPNEALPLDYNMFIAYEGAYYCLVTDQGYLAAFKLTPSGEYIVMPYMTIEYVIWDEKLP